MLHTNYSLYRENNEWFVFDSEQVSLFLDTCNKLQNTLNVLLQNPFFSKNIK